MSVQEIYFWWYVWLAIGAVITVAAAALLIGVIIAARRILRLAHVALGVVGEIEQNTKPIWQLKSSLDVADQLLGGAEAINANANTIVGALTANDDKEQAA